MGGPHQERQAEILGTPHVSRSTTVLSEVIVERVTVWVLSLQANCVAPAVELAAYIVVFIA